MKRLEARSRQDLIPTPALMRGAQPGFGLIELMVSMVIASFLVLGLVSMAGNFQTTYTAQTNFAALHDKERFASALFGSLLQEAGYFTVTYTSSSQSVTTSSILTPVTSANAPGAVYLSGQFLSGTGVATSTVPDTLNVRYYYNGVPTPYGTPAGSSNCLGETPASAGIVESVLSISSGNNLVCQVGLNGAAPTNALTGGTSAGSVTLIDGVTNMKILYNVANAGNLQYYRTVDMTSSATNYWSSVQSIQVQLTFTDSSGTNYPPFIQTYQVMYGSP